MANPTTYFGWVMPNSADLVTDLPADFNVFGQGVDTSMQFLLGGTTGQILSKTSAANMAFTWINNDQGDITGVTAGTGISGGGTSGTVTVTNDMATTITTAGDLIKGTGSGTYNRLGIGSTGQVLTVAAGAPSWATPASAGGMTLLSTTTLSGSSTTISSISQSYQTLLIYISASTSSADYVPRIIPNNTASICTVSGTTYNSSLGAPTLYRINQGDLIPEPSFLAANTANAITCQIDNYASSTSFKTVQYYGGGLRYNSDRETFSTAGLIRTTTAISSIVITTSGGGSFSAGTVLIYGVK